jgi:outer membrane protein assembly factor BamB
MKKTFFIKKITIIIFIILFILSSVTPLGIGNKINIPDDKIIVKNHSVIDYNGSVFSTVDPSIINVYNSEPTSILNKNSDSNNIFPNVFVEGPWPMYCHDERHTGRSPYSTVDNIGVEKWRFDTNNWECFGSPIIDKENIIYVGASDMFAVYPNGTMKWRFKMGGIVVSAPAIDENAILYFGTIWNEYLFAIYSDNGTEKWKYPIGYTYASPTIGPNGIIYAPATDNWNVLALYPNGTLKWSFHANERVFSSPTIGDDGTVYCTSYGSYLYALYPDNGTVKWQYHTGGYVRTSPCIADDGTVYVVSVNGVLHALYPNGTLKWQASYIDGGTSPTIGQDGTIYCGYHKLFAINPDGSLKWVFDPGNIGSIKEGTPCNSLDGTIYFGTYASNGGDLIAVNPNGTERWRIHLASGYIMSAPAIGSDGTVYVGSYNDGTPPYSYGYLHAIGPLDPDAPSAPVIDGPTSGRIKKTYKFTFNSTSPLERDVYYYINWDDHTATKWAGPYSSGEEVIINHSWSYKRTFTINARAKDSENLWGPCSTFEIKISNSKTTSNSLLFSFLERFPIFQKLINLKL